MRQRAGTRWGSLRAIVLLPMWRILWDDRLQRLHRDDSKHGRRADVPVRRQCELRRDLSRVAFELGECLFGRGDSVRWDLRLAALDVPSGGRRRRRR